MTDSPTLLYRIGTCSYKAYKPSMGLPIQASLGKPKFWTTPIPDAQIMLEIAPARAYFRASWTEFNRRYLAQLSEYGVDYLIRRFNDIGTKAGVTPGGFLVPMCFEDVPNWQSDKCHRALFRHWWARNVGETLPELSLDDSQGTLFD